MDGMKECDERQPPIEIDNVQEFLIKTDESFKPEEADDEVEFLLKPDLVEDMASMTANMASLATELTEEEMRDVEEMGLKENECEITPSINTSVILNDVDDVDVELSLSEQGDAIDKNVGIDRICSNIRDDLKFHNYDDDDDDLSDILVLKKPELVILQQQQQQPQPDILLEGIAEEAEEDINKDIEEEYDSVVIKDDDDDDEEEEDDDDKEKIVNVDNNGVLTNRYTAENTDDNLLVDLSEKIENAKNFDYHNEPLIVVGSEGDDDDEVMNENNQPDKLSETNNLPHEDEEEDEDQSNESTQQQQPVDRQDGSLQKDRSDVHEYVNIEQFSPKPKQASAEFDKNNAKLAERAVITEDDFIFEESPSTTTATTSNDSFYITSNATANNNIDNDNNTMFHDYENVDKAIPECVRSNVLRKNASSDVVPQNVCSTPADAADDDGVDKVAATNLPPMNNHENDQDDEDDDRNVEHDEPEEERNDEDGNKKVVVNGNINLIASNNKVIVISNISNPYNEQPFLIDHINVQDYDVSKEKDHVVRCDDDEKEDEEAGGYVDLKVELDDDVSALALNKQNKACSDNISENNFLLEQTKNVAKSTVDSSNSNNVSNHITSTVDLIQKYEQQQFNSKQQIFSVQPQQQQQQKTFETLHHINGESKTSSRNQQTETIACQTPNNLKTSTTSVAINTIKTSTTTTSTNTNVTITTSKINVKAARTVQTPTTPTSAGHNTKIADILPEAGCVKALVAQWSQRWSRKDGDCDDDRKMNRSRSCGPLPRKVRLLSPDGGLEDREDEDGEKKREWQVVGEDGQQYRSQPSLTRTMLVKFERMDFDTAGSSAGHKEEDKPQKKKYKWEVKEPKILSRPSFLAH
ncbi:hypothetical protein HELRODRAFT_188375 [Helobdella robusta]|uniref:Uncharacterized protein n=1 Tax=Helobdella robusta TaxID=6412 RepID=T1FPX6_HELRO|nr:hypothetical protein HELRODRAFT_188375 [Helobdella robusta]ESO06509.1 hypothetical protein HELRODRAFT_188375 [Helobdella robusta]